METLFYCPLPCVSITRWEHERLAALQAGHPRSQPVALSHSSSKCSLVFYHRDHKERREVADLRLICRFFVFSVFFAVECVLHLELLALARSG